MARSVARRSGNRSRRSPTKCRRPTRWWPKLPRPLVNRPKASNRSTPPSPRWIRSLKAIRPAPRKAPARPRNSMHRRRRSRTWWVSSANSLGARPRCWRRLHPRRAPRMWPYSAVRPPRGRDPCRSLTRPWARANARPSLCRAMPTRQVTQMTTTSRISEPTVARIGFPRMHASCTATPSAEAYRTLVAVVYQHSRIRLGPDKQPMLANRLRKRLRALGLVSYDDYCALLRSAHGPDEIEQLVDLISTNHTRFFREPEHFTFFTGRLLPELLPRLVAEGSPLRVWSAAASSGEEPYSMAIVLAEFFREHSSVDWRVEASDISRRMLAEAERGIYPLDSRHALPPELLRRYFQRGVAAQDGTCRVKADLRKRVRFQRINLFQAEYPVPRDQHVIFCRNVMIYFDQPSRAVLIHKLFRQLAPGGFLVIGHSESLMGIRHDLELVRQSVFRKP